MNIEKKLDKEIQRGERKMDTHREERVDRERNMDRGERERRINSEIQINKVKKMDEEIESERWIQREHKKDIEKIRQREERKKIVKKQIQRGREIDTYFFDLLLHCNRLSIQFNYFIHYVLCLWVLCPNAPIIDGHVRYCKKKIQDYFML